MWIACLNMIDTWSISLYTFTCFINMAVWLYNRIIKTKMLKLLLLSPNNINFMPANVSKWFFVWLKILFCVSLHEKEHVSSVYVQTHHEVTDIGPAAGINPIQKQPHPRDWHQFGVHLVVCTLLYSGMYGVYACRRDLLLFLDNSWLTIFVVLIIFAHVPSQSRLFPLSLL